MGPRRRQLLEIYLNDHWAGASAGVSLAERLAHNNTSSVWSERLTRTKPGRRFLAPSPLSRVLEAEAMIAGISAKRQLWVSLGEESLYFGDDADFDFDKLARRADAQLEVLRGFHRDAAAIAFGGIGRRLGVGT